MCTWKKAGTFYIKRFPFVAIPALYIGPLTGYYARLMLMAKAKILDLRRVSPQGEDLAGEVSTASMTRLASALALLPPTVRVQLHFVPEHGMVKVSGDIVLSAQAQCQRCLGHMPLDLTVPVRVGVAKNEALVERVDASLEAVTVEDERFDLSAWIEDELLLALPISPMCDAWQGGVCSVSGIAPYAVV